MRGIAVADVAPGAAAPALVRRERPWSRADVLAWLGALAGDTLVGIDSSPALPFLDQGAYFPGWAESPGDARALWAIVDAIAVDEPHLGAGAVVRHPGLAPFFRDGARTGARFGARGGGRLRVTEVAQQALGLRPSSCFNLVGAAQVGRSSLTTMRVLRRLGGRVPVWPFDPAPAGGPVIVEIYTTIAARAAGVTGTRSKLRDAAALDAALAVLGSEPHAPLARYDDHLTDALVTAAWLRRVSADGALWSPRGMTAEVARTEGWTFGVP